LPIGHLPGCGEAEDPGGELAVTHGAKVRAKLGPARAVGVGDPHGSLKSHNFRTSVTRSRAA
jgi:hypothetical protein